MDVDQDQNGLSAALEQFDLEVGYESLYIMFYLGMALLIAHDDAGLCHQLYWTCQDPSPYVHF